MANSTQLNEILPDVLDFGLVLLFCGTAASDVSARAGAYYANPSNAFWRALWETGITPRRYQPSEYRALLNLRIGLTDVAKCAAGVDSQLHHSDFQPDQLSQKIAHYQPQIVAFTSKTAWRAWNRLPADSSIAYGWQQTGLEGTRFFVLPSPSGAARRFWSIDPWQRLADEYARRIASL
ncbi:MAG: mismatch-specific DNA-glycosylase [Chloroflexi bacterium]|nr:mismatch-specific DNA-glycosylase [Chloroflexota bacterium]